MKHYVQTIAMIAIMIAVFSLSSCNKQETQLPEEQNHSTLVQPDQVLDLTARPKAMQASGFHTVGAPASPSQGDLGTSFRFTFKGSPADGFEGFDLYVRFTAPDGTQYPPVSMRKNGREGNYLVFTLDRVLQQAGQYRFEYVYYYNGSYRPMLGTSPQTLKVIQQSIPLGDDYHKLYYGSLPKKHCTSWVAGKINQMWNRRDFQDLLGTSDRHAKNWKDRLALYGYTASLNPKVGDIAWWEKTNSTLGVLYGHVAFVHEVRDNGNVVVISEYNYIEKSYGVRTLERNSPRVSKRFPHAFIHVQNPLH